MSTAAAGSEGGSGVGEDGDRVACVEADVEDDSEEGTWDTWFTSRLSKQMYERTVKPRLHTDPSTFRWLEANTGLDPDGPCR